MIGSLRVAVGTLTAIPVGAVALTPATARGAMLVAPVAALPLGALVAFVCWAGSELSLPAVAVAFVAVGALAAGSRALHLDGLSDVADGLTASYDRERSLAVMKGGTAGPAGVVAVVVVLGIQATALAAFDDWLLAGALVCVSRAALWITCARGVPAARSDGLGSAFTSSVPRTFVVVGWLVLAGLSALVDWWRGPLAVALAALVVVLLVTRAVRRFGGVTGDVFGAAIELALAVLLLGFAPASGV
ncbi:adenosylcobinamide-GDP ribazoletransferase [Nocardioides sp. SR21]|uniref:adenosylcobinamide-GDP ribazoletransferase n=1 Tax=Nocardioides sp. SR21 TaxID=2919501 RepID=UPI001FA9493D|nr:adenosylcobinamide-GDP ribazoletransferase [Nocardioides sp. SR21]